ncbi:hypothetical protein GV054_09085 [Marinomonas mediterranea]|uniref:Uncharacterized protein n=1 Tax=Marinomonas mediterranea (strain ATCC 700492 / JCM 21426 / NBRC 103028 / MMB-1) TaxID=717774 RepID=F2K1F5_MARM1|nr:hypothetical protein [Marinomonas mediterranea]ADZ91086.1 hypothetical protein Marme_1830 [Marinomonas mediterranea MMB-1]WCN13148.1 hypothetical protein GV054_09085 [Marinomonas mediterranea]WCN17219.1 hypothetical protein GV053_09245 [Marinomonas mediterranea MMB-1]
MELIIVFIVVVVIINALTNSGSAKSNSTHSKNSGSAQKKPIACMNCAGTGKVWKTYTEPENNLSGARMVQKRREEACMVCFGKGYH